MKAPSLSPLARRVLLHLGFWLVLLGLGVFNSLVPGSGQSRPINIAASLWVLFAFAGSTYLHNYFLLPRLLRRRRYVAYFAAVVGLILGVAWLNATLLVWWIGAKYMLAARAITLLLFMVLTLGIKLLRDDSQVRLRVEVLERTQAEQELQLLKAQVNPHFLFNTLNSIYALTLRDTGRAPDTILRLADLMRYMVATAAQPEVGLAEELTYLDNYLTLERIRLNPSAEVVFRQQGDVTDVFLAPMLLLPFVENAFKHGVETQVQNIRVEIDASWQGNELFFQVVNSKPATPPPTKSTRTGLANVRKRLQLLYPDRHELTLTETEHEYRVHLWLKL
ncbi:histidine kinase [Hymenobacter sp. BT664]|uniref:Histidine kinase n=1 Tax=Hymenobacter montanus TaxID=2771359 RepID=A0A927GIC7_9BACT|nr:histidine kinase [Hymenobacter montanus]MBD2767262.1 histidine kinase [Hymenobacter montanus]